MQRKNKAELRLRTCSVPGCPVIGGQQFFFPRYNVLRKAWQDACKIQTEIKDSMYVCKSHFQDSDIFNARGEIIRVRRGAVPSLNLPGNHIKCAGLRTHVPKNKLSKQCNHGIEAKNHLLGKPSQGNTLERKESVVCMPGSMQSQAQRFYGNASLSTLPHFGYSTDQRNHKMFAENSPELNIDHQGESLIRKIEKDSGFVEPVSDMPMVIKEELVYEEDQENRMLEWSGEEDDVNNIISVVTKEEPTLNYVVEDEQDSKPDCGLAHFANHTMSVVIEQESSSISYHEMEENEDRNNISVNNTMPAVIKQEPCLEYGDRDDQENTAVDIATPVVIKKELSMECNEELKQEDDNGHDCSVDNSIPVVVKTEQILECCDGGQQENETVDGNGLQCPGDNAVLEIKKKNRSECIKGLMQDFNTKEDIEIEFSDDMKENVLEYHETRPAINSNTTMMLPDDPNYLHYEKNYGLADVERIDSEVADINEIKGRSEADDLKRRREQEARALKEPEVLAAEYRKCVSAKDFCCGCKQQFWSYSSYMVHIIQSHLKGQQVECIFPECNSQMSDVETLVIHLSRHKYELYKCALCGVPCLTQDQVRLHELWHPVDRPYVCDSCGKGFLTAFSLRDHWDTHGPRRYGCRVCNRLFFEHRQLLAHVKSHCKCDLCGAQFANSELWQRHVRTHTNEQNEFLCRL